MDRTAGLAARWQMRESDGEVRAMDFNDGFLAGSRSLVVGETIRLLDGLFQPQPAGKVMVIPTDAPESRAVFLD